MTVSEIPADDERPPVHALRTLADRFIAVREIIPLTLLLATSLGFFVANPAFLSAANVSNMFAFIPELGIIALGMTLLLAAGVFDLSVGSVFAFAPLLMFMLVNRGGVPVELAVLVGLGIAALVGFVNGLLVTKVRISSFLVTLGMMLVVRGLGLFISEGFPEVASAGDSVLTTAFIGTVAVGPFTVYAGLVWFLGLAVVFHFLLNHMRFGNWIMATGGNARSARARGIKTDQVQIRLFVLMAVLAALAGTISAMRVSSAYPIAGQGYELEVIAMAVVGGTSLFGGKGTIIGTIIGVILLRSIRNGIIVVGVPGLAYSMFVGLIILLAMTVQALIERRAGASA
jgi:simple sugar transport system permease protein